MAAIFGRFSRQSEAVLTEAQRIAERLGRPVQTDIILLSIIAQNTTPATELLKQLGASYTKLFEQLPPLPNPGEDELPGQGQEMQLLLEESIKLAGRFRFSLVELEHILFVIARDERFVGNMVLRKSGIDRAAIVSRLSEWLISVSQIGGRFNPMGQDLPGSAQQESELEKYTTDLTELASEGELDTVIGREAELDQIIHILLRRRKNNPLLIGEPGVGKTALVDGLAQRIIERRVPAALLNKRVLNIDLSSIVAGTMYRGQFEERLKNVVQEVVSQGDCILFIDEIHTLTGTGSSEGGFDAANILKPALARGELSLIGATTHEEYRRHIRKDKALDRRFQTVQVLEPSTKQAIQMLKGSKHELEDHHHVSVTDEAIRSAVELSSRYIHDRFLPDKAIDVLDEAATYHAEVPKNNKEERSLQQEINLVSTQKSEAIERATTPEEWDYAKALSEKETQLLQELHAVHGRTRGQKGKRSKVTAHEVAMVIARRTGIPLEQVTRSLEPLDVRRIRKIMEKHIFGQNEAIEILSQSLLRAQLGLQPEHKPIGSFLFVGPTGVGKTETARILAEQVFGDKNALIKVDMSEYMERHNVSNLIGAPAGYVGFEQGGTLTEQVTRRPYSVVLFDEVEKAHPDVFNILLQILEDGMLTDNTGRVTSFEHTIIIMTSNIGMASFNQAAQIGFQLGDNSEGKQAQLESHIQRQLKDFFRPELLGRLSATIFFKPLDESLVEKLVERRFTELKSAIKQRGVTLEASPEFISWTVKQYDPEAGARSLEKIFARNIEPVLIQAILDHSESKMLRLNIEHDMLKIEPAPAKQTA